MDQRKTIPEIDRISEVSCLVEDVIGFIYSLRVGVRTPYHVPVLGNISILLKILSTGLTGS